MDRVWTAHLWTARLRTVRLRSERLAYDRKVPSFAQRERQALASLLAELGPEAPTLCEGWRAADLAAHLVLRDRRPDAAPGMVTKRAPFGPYTERLQRQLLRSVPWPELLQMLRQGPPALLRPFDSQVNSVEFFVHHEDLRRAQPGWQPRQLAREDEDVLWARSKSLARFARRRPARLEAPGREPLVLGPSGPGLKGDVGELVMWLMGRTGAARVETV